MNNSKMMFFILMIFSIFLTLSSNSWISCWMGLEINTLAFLPFIFKKNNSLKSEMSIKYFIIQSMSSINFLFLIMIMKFNLWNLKNYDNIILMNINLSLMFKLGSSPFHLWMINIIESLTWMNMFIFFTIQKLPPLILISYYLNYKFMYLMIILNCLFGSLGGLNQLSIRKIMSFSSIYNFSWMFSSLMISENMFLFFMMMYSLILISLMLFFSLMNLSYMNQLYLLKTNKWFILIILLNLLSLGGLPPFLGFITKWIISISFIKINSFIIIILMMSSLINLYYYIQLMYPIFLLNKFEIKWFQFFNKNLNWNLKIWIWIFFSFTNLILISFFMFMF
uniref:NADH-ubiquinone oxidoreductase chain 2 n=1 Tax=Hydromanicus wulaianus TaxID=1435189 RepID=A0A342CFH6_9NEOP|nr:NADH dehydrogenase subunit 2 [Hydromanicus wulaianus]AHC32052.1 NADH dehydrogenase subunit 2 [Hydromanicus wulaianus]